MKLKISLLCFIVIMVSSKMFSQQDILSGMHGLSQKGNQVYETGGSVILVMKENAKLQEKDIKKIKKKYALNNVVSEYSDPKLNQTNLVITTVEEEDKEFPDIKTYQLCYLLPKTEKEMDVVIFQSYFQRDSLLEREFMKLYFDNKLSQYVSDNWEANEVDFIGRRIQLGSACHWMYPHSVQCPGYGQMNWSTFATEKEAQANNDIYRVVKNSATKKFKVLKAEDINIIFEGEPTFAKRVAYKVNVPKFLLGTNNILIVYYVVQKVRDYYVSCVLSHYADSKNENDYDLAPLLDEVMSLDVKK